jgi:hypothetical protein
VFFLVPVSASPQGRDEPCGQLDDLLPRLGGSRWVLHGCSWTGMLGRLPHQPPMHGP